MINYENIKGKNRKKLNSFLNDLIEKNEQIKGKYKEAILDRLDKQIKTINDFKKNKINYESMIKINEIQKNKINKFLEGLKGCNRLQ